MIRGLALVCSAIGLMAAGPDALTLRGTVRDCDGPVEIHISGVSIAAFNPSRSAELVRILDDMNNDVLVVSDTAAMRKYNERYDRLMLLVQGPGAIARATSNVSGEFTLAVPRLDSVLVFGYRDLEDEPYYFAYTKVPVSARGTFYLDMSRGACKYQ